MRISVFFRLRRLLLPLTLAVLSPATQAQSNPSPVEAPVFRQDDRVMLIGDTFLEREAKYGWLETAAQRSFPSLNLRFRNFAWSGDTPAGDARSYFGPPEEGLQRLETQTEAWKPTLLLFNYGSQAAFSSDEGSVDAFLASLDTQIQRLLAKSAEGARVVLVSPAPVISMGPPMPDLGPVNEKLKLVTARLKEYAASKGYGFADLNTALLEGQKLKPALSVNGVQFNEEGYQTVSGALAELLGCAPAAEGDKALRALVIRKDSLHFDQWRPANETYLFGFRKHEQGRNAAEIPRFDPLIQSVEDQIHKEAGTPAQAP